MTKSKQQSCGTCFYGRFNQGGLFLCHYELPQVHQVKDGFQSHVPVITPEYWGCHLYQFSAEVKALPKPVAK